MVKFFVNGMFKHTNDGALTIFYNKINTHG